MVKNGSSKSDRRHTWLEFSFNFHESIFTLESWHIVLQYMRSLAFGSFTAWFCLIKAMFQISQQIIKLFKVIFISLSELVNF
jgi:hypothetical protein